MTALPTRTQLTKNQRLVLGVLTNARGPLSAYSILDALRADGFRAPPQVYRALEKLRALGLVHRLESLNAFVVCSHPDCTTENVMAFAICEVCGDVSEFASRGFSRSLKGWASAEGFKVGNTTVEVQGLCRGCAGGAGQRSS